MRVKVVEQHNKEYDIEVRFGDIRIGATFTFKGEPYEKIDHKTAMMIRTGTKYILKVERRCYVAREPQS